ncbi:MAG: cytochrome c [Verrucomicrobiae bacterium]|nr:cytochrome c [Verrucomicrobiae bacterium]
MRYFIYAYIFTLIVVVSVAGYRGQKSVRRPLEFFPDMDRQMKIKFQVPDKFFENGLAARTPVGGTLAKGTFSTNTYFMTGAMGTVFGDGLPVPVTVASITRGQDRYNINCAVCHGKAGDGNGVVGNYGLAGIANLTDPAYRTMSDGHLFHTITHGKGNMGPYGSNITPEDRWNIVAYIRALQKLQASQEKPQASTTPAAAPAGNATR